MSVLVLVLVSISISISIHQKYLYGATAVEGAGNVS